ncbi:hypothetical protein TIFTF001_049018 [Ficus carica]|uniref:Uncharacterized protein n=1 Tax=Ficus carica TaxID=3494 RepID=A0AA87Z2B5_FICCA|nr:hypothetical protein TIFTF001_049018 [Ficus carica]
MALAFPTVTGSDSL